ncbi:alpha/beta hydrolase [Kaistia geumhonensis]|uniref:Pimeloyl-ACP methyl ester carboxylesterase n=1 Tax=Kaistia geumhonensis TaxID=410839 RepID=A0ABU0M323_9HYPH|nr:alpha/beta hydrolase [Kaistia geumhonensis]MCX5479434.1 alpha/beta hydrolase [Kaistia geumhonensis]MDQ0515343.1 pimeloyl-ACP methyl ester carboxylesterase [Kaistia geumhonensis]
MRLVANGIGHEVLIAGPEDGPPVLLIHGLGWDHSLWKGQIARLAAEGYRVVAPDLRGMGATDKPDMPYAIDLYAEDMLALMDALSTPRFAVAGFSLGGIVAAAMIGKAEERLAAALIACCAVHATPGGEAGTEVMLARATTLGPLAFAREQAAAIWHEDYAAENPEAVERFVVWRAGMDQAALRRAFRSGYRVDYRPALARTKVPVRFIAADRDPFASVAAMAELDGLTPDSDLVVIERSGHMAPIEQPAAFDAALIDFLDRQAR